MAPPKKQVSGPLQLRSESPQDTVDMAEKVGEMCRPNDVICLQGTLGAGKTHFVKGLAKGLGIKNPAAVTSPTYVLLQEYKGGRLKLFHFDAYRLEHADEMADIGCEEFFNSGGVCVVEWADHVDECLPEEHFLITIRIKGEARRDILFGAFGVELPERMDKIGEALSEWRVET